MRRECAAKLCRRAVTSGRLMCANHWHQVPADLQREVYRTWNAWRKDFGNADLLHAYTHAADAAVASV